MNKLAYLWSDLDLQFVSFYKTNYTAEKTDAKKKKKKKKTAQNRAAPKVAIMVISV